VEIRRYARLLRKWLWLIIISAVLAGAIAYGVSRRSTPIYEASATLMVNQASNPASTAGYSDILTSERLARTYANLLTSWPVIDETARRLGVAPITLKRNISVTPVRDTQLLQIQVQGPDPELLAAVANTLPQVFIERNREMQLGRLLQSKASIEEEMASKETDLANAQLALEKAVDETERARLETELKESRNTYSSLVASYQQITLAETQAANNIVAAEPAKTPTAPIRPRTLLNTLLAFLAGAAAATGAALLIEYMDDTIKSPTDVTRVTGLSTLGAISRLKDSNGRGQIVTWSAARAPESEAYRILRTNIQFSSVDRPLQTLLVTSSGPGEGKSTTAANLAVAIAQTGQRVVLVDTDLRRPSLHRLFNLPNNVGLTTSLLHEGIIPLQPTSLENLSVLTSGPIPPNPSELLGSQRMTHLVESLLADADLVMFDSPPVLAVTDAAVLGRQLDGVLLVVDAAQTREPALVNAQAELRKTGANILGVALNRLDSRSGEHYYYYYSYYSEENRSQDTGPGSDGGNGAKPRRPWQRKPA